MNEKHATAGAHELNATAEIGNRGNKDSNKDESRPSAAKNPQVSSATSAPENKASSSVATTLATTAFLIALASAGGGYYLWQNLAQVQLSASRNEGVSVAELEKSEANLRSWVSGQTDKAAAETATLVSSTRGELEKQVGDLNTKIEQVAGELRQGITTVQGAVSQQESTIQAAVSDTKAALQQQIQQAQGAAQTDVAGVRTEVAALGGAFQELRDQVTTRVQTSEDTQKALQATVAQSQLELKEAVGRNQLHWALNEVEYMLSIANRQVALEQNVARAVTTLRTADQRLQSLGDPGLVKIREAVQNDIAALEQAGSPDLEGVALTIDRLSSSVAQLPTPSDRVGKSSEDQQVPEDASVTDQAAGAAKGLAQAAWDSLRGLVVIKEHGEVAAPFLPPDQLYFLQQNLKLQLSAARLAAMQQNNGAYQSSLDTAVQWTNKYFDTSVAQTQQFASELERLKSVNVAPQLPDVSQSLRVLREVRPGLAS